MRRSLRPTVTAACAVLVLGLAAVLAAHVRPSPTAPVSARLATDGDAAPPVTPAADGRAGVPWWLLVIVIVVVLLALAIVWFTVRDLLLTGREELAEPSELRHHAAPGRAGKVATAAALAEATDALDAGADPREVVIACWVRLEAAAAQAGQGRRPAETATDVARRWLAGSPDRAAVDDLAALFHEARYSTHPVTDAHRARARAALAGATDRQAVVT